MATFVMVGKYAARSLQEVSIQRTDRVVAMIKQLGGEVQAMYATLGAYDVVFIVSLPSTEVAVQASVALTKMTGIALTTMPAVGVQEFDRLMSEI